jgi:hypothetical protein
MVGCSRPIIRRERRGCWRRQLARRVSGNASAIDFCRQLGVSITTSYYRNKRVDEVSLPSPRLALAQSPSRRWAAAATFVPVTLVVDSGDTIQIPGTPFIIIGGDSIRCPPKPNVTSNELNRRTTTMAVSRCPA